MSRSQGKRWEQKSPYRLARDWWEVMSGVLQEAQKSGRGKQRANVLHDLADCYLASLEDLEETQIVWGLLHASIKRYLRSLGQDK